MIRALLVLSISLPALAQNASPDTQLTQTLITEIRQLRQDLQTMAATIQRIQIVMYRLQAQTAIMNRASSRLDDAHNRCIITQQQYKTMSVEIQRAEERLRTTQSPTEQKQIEDMITRFKSQIEMSASDAQQCQVRESEADSQYRAEKAKMAELEDQLDKLDKLLAAVGK